jgi:NADPH:quinone reductase-like Zn-dependent oxidoreductase
MTPACLHGPQLPPVCHRPVARRHRGRRLSPCALPAASSGDGDGQPATYARLVATVHGASFRDVAVLEAGLQVPAPGPGQALVRVTHAGVNGGCETFRARQEHWFAANRRQTGSGIALGAEGVGVVAALGSGCPETLQVGDAVAFVGGAFAEYVVVNNAASLQRLRAPTAEAVACVISGSTAAVALTCTARVQSGEVVLVTAAAGATGSFAVQVAARCGAHVIAVCGGPAKAALCASLGAHRVIDHTAEDVGAVLKTEYTRGVDVVYEGVGGAMLSAILPHLAPRARCMVIGYISGYPHATGTSPAPPQNDLTEGLFWGGGTLEIEGGRQLIGSVFPDRGAMLAAKRQLWEDFDAGRIRAVVDSQRAFIGLASTVEAVDYMLSGKALGKVVVSMAPRGGP